MPHQKNSTLLGTVVLSGLLLLTGGGPTFCQDSDPSDLESRDIPRRLLLPFERRLSQFIEYQRTGQWDKLPDYLVYFHPPGTGAGNISYTREQIDNLRESLKEKQLLQLTDLERVAGFPPSTPLNKRVWQIWGCAVYKEGEQTFRTQAMILVYYLNQTFVFSPVKLAKYSADGATVPCPKRAGKRGR